MLSKWPFQNLLRTALCCSPLHEFSDLLFLHCSVSLYPDLISFSSIDCSTRCERISGIEQNISCWLHCLQSSPRRYTAFRDQAFTKQWKQRMYEDVPLHRDERCVFKSTVQYYKRPNGRFRSNRWNDGTTETLTLKSQALQLVSQIQNDRAGGRIASSANIHVTIKCIFSNLESISLMVYPIFQYKIIGIQFLTWR